MKAIITPRQLHGSIKTVASKSQAHRMLICAAFADEPTDIICRELSLDIEATAKCLEAMGSSISYDRESGSFHVVPVTVKRAAGTPEADYDENAKTAEDEKEISIDVGESGSTLRFLLPVVCALGVKTHIVMHGRLSERPLSPLWEELEAHGAELKRNADGSVDVSGRLKGSRYTIAADVSSQFISGLLFAAPLIAERAEDFELELTGNVESVSYILMTIEALKSFGVEVVRDGSILRIRKDAAFTSPHKLTVEGDWSNGAFWLCASAMTEDKLEVTGLNEASVQGDRAVVTLIDDIVKRRTAAGAESSEAAAHDTADKCSAAVSDDAVYVDARNVPDLVPVLSVLAASVKGVTVFTHAERLRIKESDRIKAAVTMLKALGADAEETADGLIVRGTGEKLAGGTVDSCNDHRIAMSAAVASIICRGTVTVLTAQAVRKSYPAFWEDFALTGGCAATEE